MRKVYWIFFAFLLSLGAACSSDDNGGGDKLPEEKGVINLAVSGRVGSVVGDRLTAYVKSLDLLLFRENNNGVYLLFRNISYTETELEALLDGGTDSGAGFTVSKKIDFSDLPVGNYRIAGVGNMTDSVGTAWPNATLSGVNIGNTMDDVVAVINSGTESPRLFFGLTDPIALGTEIPATPQLVLYRKVAMFNLALEQVPAAVRQIDVEIQNTYGAFAMTGDYVNNRVISVNQTNHYQFTEVQASLPMAVITLPTVSGQKSQITLNFFLANGQEITIPLPDPYALKQNTITKLTATINANESGGQWDVQLTISVSADVEWNVDQEPSIII